MGEKSWVQDFGTGMDRLRIHFVTEQGRVTAIIVIQYEAYIDGKWRAIVRFDEAHGFFHRDVLSATGGQEKVIYPAMDKSVALNEALKYMNQFWRLHRQWYEEEWYENK